MNNDLVFDLGMHEAQDTNYYLSLGYRVVAVDASVEMVEKAQRKYAGLYTDKNLTVLNYAMSDKDGESVEFYISQKSEWNSIFNNIACRQGCQTNSVIVPTITLSSLISQFGVPHYCKIDVEGFDHICINTLKNCSEIPRYISCETECFSENQVVCENDILLTLNSLYYAGYRKFKLVDQHELAGLDPRVKFYGKRCMNYLSNVINKIISGSNYRIVKLPFREFLSKKHHYYFPYGSTGPFGENAPGEWMNYETAKKCLLRHREDFFKMDKNQSSYTIWCDWHATF